MIKNILGKYISILALNLNDILTNDSLSLQEDLGQDRQGRLDHRREMLRASGTGATTSFTLREDH